jgi:hypothetical protein
MTIPEALQKILKSVCKKDHSSKFASPWTRTSSTNNKSDIKVSTTTFSPLKDPFVTAFFICLLRHSITRRNKSGERGHPCLNPRWLLKKDVGDPFISTVILTLVTQASIVEHPT